MEDRVEAVSSKGRAVVVESRKLRLRATPMISVPRHARPSTSAPTPAASAHVPPRSCEEYTEYDIATNIVPGFVKHRPRISSLSVMPGCGGVSLIHVLPPSGERISTGTVW